MKRTLLSVILVVTLLGIGSAIYVRSLYPADLHAYEKEYEELVHLTLGCCFENDYWRSLEELISEEDIARNTPAGSFASSDALEDLLSRCTCTA